MSTVKIKTAELEGDQLDLAVALAFGIGGDVGIRTGYGCSYYNGAGLVSYNPSSNWALCGMLMEVHSISCYQSTDPETRTLIHWVAVAEKHEGRRKGLVASNPKTAICRSIVASKLGDTVEIPAELLEAV